MKNGEAASVRQLRPIVRSVRLHNESANVPGERVIHLTQYDAMGGLMQVRELVTCERLLSVRCGPKGQPYSTENLDR